MASSTIQCVRGVLDPPVSVFSLSLYRHPFLYTLFTSRFTLIINNNCKIKLGVPLRRAAFPVPTLLAHAYTQVYRFSQPKLAHVAELRETDVSKCVWQQGWCFWTLTLPVPTLLAHVCTHHTIPHSPHNHDPHFHGHSGPLVSSVFVQDSCLRCDHDTQY